MQRMALDTETALIRPGCLAPPLACISWATSPDDAGVVHWHDARTWFDDVLARACAGELLLVGHNIAYDMAVLAAHHPAWLPHIFEVYARGVYDTKIAQQLIDIATGEFKTRRHTKGGYALAALSRASLDKDTWRLKYGDLRALPLSEWPQGAIEYARMDAIAALDVANLQEPVVDLEPQCRADFALHLMSCYGMRTDEHNVRAFLDEAKSTIDVTRDTLVAHGLMRVVGKKLAKDTKAIGALVVSVLGDDTPQTATGRVKLDEETIDLCGDNPMLAHLVAHNKATKLYNNWRVHLERGTHTPIQPRYNVLVESGRTSCQNPNIQQLHRAGGLRECFAPREGYVFASVDYASLEMCTLAQACLDLGIGSNLGEAINGGLDPHLHVAAQLLHIDYAAAAQRLAEGDAEVKHHRQISKILNFGLPGGLGAATFVQYARGYGVTLSQDEAETLRRKWFDAWPEMQRYFEHISALVGRSTGTVHQLRSGRVRGDVSYTQTCNSYFQGLAADGAKDACFAIARAAYADKTSALYGSRPVAFIHDEILAEVPIDTAHEAATELARLMVESMRKYCPDVEIKAEPCLMARWYKEARPVYVDGRLEPWEPSLE